MFRIKPAKNQDGVVSVADVRISLKSNSSNAFGDQFNVCDMRDGKVRKSKVRLYTWRV